MPSRASYLLIIAGRLRGHPRTNTGIIKQIQGLFAPPRGRGTGGPAAREAEWPRGFVLRGYNVCVWSAEADAYGPNRNETLFTFRAEIHHSRPGTLYDNRRNMVPEVRWFYNYRRYRWHRDLINRLRRVNEEIAKGKLIVPIWFCAYQWYCGNGGP